MATMKYYNNSLMPHGIAQQYGDLTSYQAQRCTAYAGSHKTTAGNSVLFGVSPSIAKYVRALTDSLSMLKSELQLKNEETKTLKGLLQTATSNLHELEKKSTNLHHRLTKKLLQYRNVIKAQQDQIRYIKTQLAKPCTLEKTPVKLAGENRQYQITLSPNNKGEVSEERMLHDCYRSAAKHISPKIHSTMKEELTFCESLCKKYFPIPAINEETEFNKTGFKTRCFELQGNVEIPKGHFNLTTITPTNLESANLASPINICDPIETEEQQNIPSKRLFDEKCHQMHDLSSIRLPNVMNFAYSTTPEGSIYKDRVNTSREFLLPCREKKENSSGGNAYSNYKASPSANNDHSFHDNKEDCPTSKCYANTLSDITPEHSKTVLRRLRRTSSMT